MLMLPWTAVVIRNITLHCCLFSSTTLNFLFRDRCLFFLELNHSEVDVSLQQERSDFPDTEGGLLLVNVMAVSSLVCALLAEPCTFCLSSSLNCDSVVLKSTWLCSSRAQGLTVVLNIVPFQHKFRAVSAVCYNFVVLVEMLLPVASLHSVLIY